MKNSPPEHYPPLVRKATAFLTAAQKLEEAENRLVGSWEVSYYLLTHAIELAIKSVYEMQSGKKASRGHKLLPLAKKYQAILPVDELDITTLEIFDKLNSGRGGLRYDNEPPTNFMPPTFSEGVKIAQKLLEEFE